MYVFLHVFETPASRPKIIFPKIDTKTWNPRRLFLIEIFLSAPRGRKKKSSATTWRGQQDFNQK